MIYLPLRLWGVTQGDDVINDYALSVLSCESALLFPRYVPYHFCVIRVDLLV
jgi:hypothetical protein